ETWAGDRGAPASGEERKEREDEPHPRGAHHPQTREDLPGLLLPTWEGKAAAPSLHRAGEPEDAGAGEAEARRDPARDRRRAPRPGRWPRNPLRAEGPGCAVPGASRE